MIIDGIQLALDVAVGLKAKIRENNLKLQLAAVLVGENKEFKKFVELKGKAAKEIGVGFKLYQFPENISTSDLKKEVRKISEDKQNSGVLVELPLPAHVDVRAVLNEVQLEKDIDVLSEKAQSLFYGGKSKILPPAVEAVKIALEKYCIEPKGGKVAVFGQGLLVGKPVAHWFEQKGAQVFRIDEFTKNPEQYSHQADIIVSGVGKPDLITGDMVKDGVAVFDFGYENKDGKMVGDVDTGSVVPKTSLVTPVPGGMGPIVIAAVLKNLVELNS